MKITLNGNTKDISAAHLAALVEQFCPQKRHIMTEVNGNIIPSNDWEKTSIKEGDTVELVSFVGGG